MLQVQRTRIQIMNNDENNPAESNLQKKLQIPVLLFLNIYILSNTSEVVSIRTSS
jgi:hypothetical protein